MKNKSLEAVVLLLSSTMVQTRHVEYNAIQTRTINTLWYEQMSKSNIPIHQISEPIYINSHITMIIIERIFFSKNKDSLPGTSNAAMFAENFFNICRITRVHYEFPFCCKAPMNFIFVCVCMHTNIFELYAPRAYTVCIHSSLTQV